MYIKPFCLIPFSYVSENLYTNLLSSKGTAVHTPLQVYYKVVNIVEKTPSWIDHIDCMYHNYLCIYVSLQYFKCTSSMCSHFFAIIYDTVRLPTLLQQGSE